MESVRLVRDVRNVVGESAVWDEWRQQLFWVDIVGRRIPALSPAEGAGASWPTPEIVTSIGLRKDGGFVVGLQRDVTLWEPGGAFEPLARVEPEAPDNRLNEGVVGPDGAFWVGTMQNNINPDGSPREIDRKSGAIYRVQPDGSVVRLTEPEFSITNTLVWTGDGRLVTADTLADAIYSYALPQGDGPLRDRRTILSGAAPGLPDGSCLDGKGRVWNCRVGGGAVVRFTVEGSVERTVELACSAPTSCAFGGPGLDVLYVTSARFGMSEAHLREHPHEGGLFAVSAGVGGTLPHRFG